MKTTGWIRRSATFLALAGAFVFGPAVLRADDGNDAASPTGRAVRLSSVDGTVQVSQGAEVLADHALVNTPLFEGMTISTGDDGRAEVQFEDGSVARIPPDSALTFTVLRPGEAELTLEDGMGYFELQDSSATRVRFGSNVVTTGGFTVLRVKLDQQPGELAVFSGNAHVDAGGGVSMDVRGGESVSLGSFNLSENIAPDSWDAWNSDRDQDITTTEVGSTPATDSEPNSGDPAWGDLNSSGTWYDVPDQGYVWSPYEASNVGWDPYGIGYWMWTPRFGYIWVSGYRWGFLPYQCGAWNWYDSFGWGWAPGGCTPWWGGGVGVWGFSVGYMPRWYRLPVRPIGPRPRSPRSIRLGDTPRAPLGLRPAAPLISVNHREPAPVPVLPPRTPGHPVEIGRVVAQPLRPAAPRPLRRPIFGDNHTPVRPVGPVDEPGSPAGNPSHGPANGVRSGYQPAPVNVPRPIYAPAPRPVGSPSNGMPSGSVTVPRPNPAPVYRPAPAPAPRPSAPSYRPAPAPRPSGGGGARPAPAPRPSGGGAHPSPR